MKSPYYKIYIASNGRDITEFVEKISYEDATDEDNLVVFKVDQQYAMRLADDEDFITGNIISFQFGFMGGVLSPLHQAKITDISHSYRERVQMTLKCLDLGTKIKKTTSQKIWENMTTSEIAESIAGKFNMTTEIRTTTKKWKHVPQGNKNDLDFLKYLTAREGNGNLVIYIRNNTLYLTERALTDESKVTFTYGFGEGTLVSFDPTVKESGANPSFNQTATVNIDQKSGTVTATVVDNDTEEPTGTTGSYKVVYGADKGEKRGEIFEDNKTVGKPNLEPTEDNEEAKSLANSTKKAASLSVMTAKLTVEGNPLMTPNSILTVKNVARRHLGNWLVAKVTHNIANQAYVTVCELKSNGAKTKAISTDKATDPNKSEGAETINDEVKLLVVDANTGEPRGYSSSSVTVPKSN